jgi:hypothetical protein
MLEKFEDLEKFFGKISDIRKGLDARPLSSSYERMTGEPVGQL